MSKGSCEQGSWTSWDQTFEGLRYHMRKEIRPVTGLPLLRGTSCVVRTRKLKLQRKHLGFEVLLKLANIY